jgi:hypothetical protein
MVEAEAGDGEGARKEVGDDLERGVLTRYLTGRYRVHPD